MFFEEGVEGLLGCLGQLRGDSGVGMLALPPLIAPIDVVGAGREQQREGIAVVEDKLCVAGFERAAFGDCQDLGFVVQSEVVGFGSSTAAAVCIDVPGE